MRYVGNYSAIVTVDFNLDANDRTLLPFDEITENLSQFSTRLKELIEAELDENEEVQVCELRCEIRKEV